jgi:hypothetical protein
VAPSSAETASASRARSAWACCCSTYVDHFITTVRDHQHAIRGSVKERRRCRRSPRALCRNPCGTARSA